MLVYNIKQTLNISSYQNMGRKYLCNLFIKHCFHNRPDFTKNRFGITRRDYTKLDANHIGFFKNLLGSNRVILDRSNLEKYNVDFFLFLRGNSSIVLKPQTTDEVSQILTYCNQNKLAVCPQGGNTGACGASVPVFDEIIISAELLNKIISLDEYSGALMCESGCILENLDEFVSQKGLIVPLDLSSKGSCQIGGNISTNAGGVRLLKYGNMHGNVLGLEVVKPNGEILNIMNNLRKDNTGFHLKNLFIGAEGTLGFITKVALQCAARPKYNHVAFLGLQDFNKVLKTFRKAKSDLGEILSAFEVLDYETIEFVREFNKQDSPIGDYPFYLLIETFGTNEEHDYEKLNNFFEMALNKHLILNGTVVQEPSKIEAIWKVRDVAPGFRVCGPLLQYDLSLPLENYYTITDSLKQHVGNLSPRIFGFGHLGDGNIHLNVQLTKDDSDIRDYVENFLYKNIAKFKGSISAEHGIGFLKTKHLRLNNSGNAIMLMKNIKKLMDPNDIMNPYKVLD